MGTPSLRRCRYVYLLLTYPTVSAFLCPQYGPIPRCHPRRTVGKVAPILSNSPPASIGDDDAIESARRGFSQRRFFTQLRAKKRSRTTSKGLGETDWYGDDGDDPASESSHAEDRGVAKTSTSTTRPPPLASAATATAVYSRERPAKGRIPLDAVLESLSSTELDSANVAPDLGSEEDHPGVYPYENTSLLEEEWDVLEKGDRPLVEQYGLDTDVDDFDGLDQLNHDSAEGTGGGSLDGSAHAGAIPEDPSVVLNGMDVPDDDLREAGLLMTRDLDEMLMERAIRFYDPQVTGEREKCYLVGLEATGWGSSPGGRRGLQYKVPQERSVDGEEDEDWDDEREAAYQEERQLAYEARKEEREMRFSLKESMAELSELAGTAGLEVAGSTYQRVLEPNPRTYIGTGKVKEIRAAMNQLGVCTVIFDDELSPGQQRSLEAEFGGEEAGIKVIDRTALILDIFAQHARTREGQLQVELALLMYRLPRLTRMWTHLGRQQGGAARSQGGVGLRGPGERQLEVDRRLLQDKIMDLKKELVVVRKHRNLQRRGRKRLGLPVIALVGYTNAGKSTLLNRLTRAGVMAENMLFATLDPTTRKVKLTGLKVHPEVMLTDTVGFIQKLPTNLVAAFRATLEELVEADVIVHIVDVSSESRSKQESAVMGVLREMGVDDKPRLVMWNKLDLLPGEAQDAIRAQAAMREELTVAASAKTGEWMDDVVAVLEEALSELLMEVEAVVPYSRGDLLSRVHELGACDREEFTDAGTLINARVPQEMMNRLEPYYTDGFRDRLLEMERARLGDAEAVAKQEEMDWKLVAKKRTKTPSEQRDQTLSPG